MNTVLNKGDRPLIVYFLICFVLAWSVMGVAIASNLGLIDVAMPIEPILVFGSWIPNIAAFLVLALIIRREGAIRSLLRGWLKFGVPAVWYIIALSPVLFALLTIGLYGFIFDEFPVSGAFTDPLMLFALLVLGIITGAMGEELGWRGFALPWLQTRMNALWGSLVLGIIWGLWHLPLWFAGLGFEETPYLPYFVTGLSFTVLATWACNNAYGSMVIASLFHLALNFAINLIEPQALWVFAALITLAAVVVAFRYGPQKLSRNESLPIDREKKAWLE